MPVFCTIDQLRAIVAGLGLPSFVLEATPEGPLRLATANARFRQLHARLAGPPSAAPLLEESARPLNEAPLVSPAFSGQLQRQASVSLGTQNPVEYDVEVGPPSGAVRWWHMVLSPLPAEPGKGGRLLVTVLDNTEEVRSRQKLDLMANALDAVPVGITIADPSRSYLPIIHANPAFCRMTQLTPDKVLGRSLFFLHEHGPDRDLAARLREAAGRRQTSVVEALTQRKDGSRVWSEIAIVPVPEGKGAPMCVVAVHTDITMRKTTDRLLDTVFASAADGLCLIDGDGRLLRVNPEWSRLTGYGEAEVLDQDWGMLLPPEAQEAARHHYRHYLVGDTDTPPPVPEIITKDGARRMVRLRAQRFVLDNGLRYVIAALADVSDFSELDEARRRAEEARAEAERASQAKSEFLASMSHEIRTPLNGVLANLELLGQTRVSVEQAELLRSAELSAKILLGVIGEILDFSRIEARKVDLALTNVSPSAVVEDVASLLAGSAAQKGLTLTTFVHADVPRLIRSDVGRLRQILTNFVGNAIKFTRQGGIHIVLRTQDTADGQRMLRFEVHDTGEGFDPGMADRLFGAFVQAEAQAAKPGSGTGLGLAISKGLAEMLGGTVSCDSAPGEGASFWFCLPVKPGRDGNRGYPPALTGHHVLIWVADQGVAEALRDVLAEHGAAVVTAHTRREAMALTAEHDAQGRPLAAAILDGADRDGLTAARDLASTGVPLILISDEDSPAHRRHAYSAGIRHVLPLPADQQDLLCMVATPSSFGQRERPKATVGLFGAFVDLVRHRTAALLGKRPGSRRMIGSVSLPFGGGHTPHCLLVVEDNPMNQEVMRRQLRQLGLNCVIVGTGPEGLRKLDEDMFAAMLVDCGLPGMDGFEVTRHIREAERQTGRRIPIVAVTANALDGTAERCRAAGMDDYITKPVSLARLADVLRRWLPPEPRPNRESRREPPREARDEVRVEVRVEPHLAPRIDLRVEPHLEPRGEPRGGGEPEAPPSPGLPPHAPTRQPSSLDMRHQPHLKLNLSPGVPGYLEPPFARPATAPLDLEQLAEKAGTRDVRTLRELLDYFVDVQFSFHDDLHRLASERKRIMLRDAAHGARGGALDATATALADLLHRLEQAAEDDNWPLIEELLVSVEEEFAVIRRFVRTIGQEQHP